MSYELRLAGESFESDEKYSTERELLLPCKHLVFALSPCTALTPHRSWTEHLVWVPWILQIVLAVTASRLIKVMHFRKREVKLEIEW